MIMIVSHSLFFEWKKIILQKVIDAFISPTNTNRFSSFTFPLLVSSTRRRRHEYILMIGFVFFLPSSFTIRKTLVVLFFRIMDFVLARALYLSYYHFSFFFFSFLFFFVYVVSNHSEQIQNVDNYRSIFRAELCAVQEVHTTSWSPESHYKWLWFRSLCMYCIFIFCVIVVRFGHPRTSNVERLRSCCLLVVYWMFSSTSTFISMYVEGRGVHLTINRIRWSCVYTWRLMDVNTNMHDK